MDKLLQLLLKSNKDEKVGEERSAQQSNTHTKKKNTMHAYRSNIAWKKNKKKQLIKKTD